MKLWRIFLSLIFGLSAIALGIFSYYIIDRDIMIVPALGSILLLLLSMSMAQDDGMYRER
jgi:hypothetical protein